ncbi:MAG: sulfatase-like hydrolase/transferase [Planctomycetaceae bacterium]|nr:sulfatase-like hydrolase/transferase [Planctomycetaceae bacterium]
MATALRHNLKFLCLGLAVVICLVATIEVSAAAPGKPNLIVIMADDLGFECLEVNGGTSYKTPRLNQMAAEGMRFTHCYAQPICTPSRVQLMTGMYNQRNYVRFGLLEPHQTTFAQVLQRAGYRTMIAGKWQLEGGLKGPNHFGFDEYCLWQLTRRPSRYPNPGLEVNGEEKDYPEKYGPDIVSDAICEFIRDNQKDPFLVYYPMILPHWPFEPTPDSPAWDPKSPGESNSQKHPEFFVDMVAYTDKMVGKILDQVDACGLSEQTFILFTGDNGTATSVTSMLGDRPFRGGKGSPTDAGMHVPMIARWPGKIGAGKETDRLVDFTDIFPTLLDLAGVVQKPRQDLQLDGLSMAPTLLETGGLERAYIYCWYARDGGETGVEFVQDHDYKLYRDGRVFNIAEDPLEKTPLQEPWSDAAATSLKTLKPALEKYDNTRVMLNDPAAKNKQKTPRKNPKTKSAE